MKRMGLAPQPPRHPAVDLTARTGGHCPVTGLWRPAGSQAEAVFIFQGSLMPAFDGDSADWEWVEPGS